MQLDSAGRLSIKQYFQDMDISPEEKVAYFYLCWYKRTPRGEEKPRILIEVAESSEAPDLEKMYLGKVNVDPKWRICMYKVLNNVYGVTTRGKLGDNFLVYSLRGKLFIEKD